MKVIDVDINQNFSIGNITIGKREGKDIIFLSIDNEYYMENNDVYIKNFFHKLKELNFNSILICGLGLGLLPYHCKKNLKIESIDVIEINSNLITLINQLAYLDGISLICDNALEFTSNKRYDLIVGDIWWNINDNFENEKNKFISNYLNNLNSNGKIYIPITQEII